MASSMVFIKLLAEPEGIREGGGSCAPIAKWRRTAGAPKGRRGFPYYVEVARYNCSQTNENDQLLLFRSTTVPRSVRS